MRSMLSERVIAAPTTFRIGRQRRDFFSFHLISSCGGGPLRRVTRAGTRMMILRPRANCAYSVPASARVPPKPEGTVSIAIAGATIKNGRAACQEKVGEYV